ncbi:MAG: phosphate ABC transporter permease subunit PstC [Planctomycetota bacterium]
METDKSTLKKISPWQDAFFKYLTAACSITLLVIVTLIGYLLIEGSSEAFERYGFGFVFSTDWNPPKQLFGAASSIYGTLLSSFIAMVLAVPLSLVIALFLVELAHPIISKPLGSAIELLAAIPSIIYGMWGIFVFAPFLSKHIQPFLYKYVQKGMIDPVCKFVGGFFVDQPGTIAIFDGPKNGLGMFTAGIILAIMILPFISAVIRDVLTMVPSVVKESAYGLGATAWEVTSKVTFKYGLSGIIGGSLLGLGRAIGETMAVTYVIGNSHRLSTKLFQGSNTIASTLANEFAEAQGVFLSSLIFMAFLLFVITFIVQLVFQWWLKRVRMKTGIGL